MPRTDPKLTEKIREAARRLLADAPTVTGREIARAAGLTPDQGDDLQAALLSTAASAEFQCFQIHGDGGEQALSFWDGYDADLTDIHYRLRLDENGRVPPSWAQFITAPSRFGDGDGEPRVMGALEWRCSNCRAHSIRFGQLKHHDLCYHGPLQVRRDMQPRLQELLSEHNKKAAKLGVGGGLKFRVIREFTVPEHVFVGTATASDPFGDVCKVPGCSPKGDPKHWFDAPYVEIQLDGEVPKLPGWSILGRIEATPGGNLVLEAPGQKIPAKYRTAESRCDHCGLKRNRKDTIVIQKGDQVVQVGRNCLQDFIGTTDAEEMVRMFLLFAAKWKEIMDRIREGDGGSERLPSYEGMSLRELLQYTAASVRMRGFVSKAYAERSDYRRRPTADDVREAYIAVRFGGKQDDDPRTPTDLATAATAAEWIAKMVAAPGGEVSNFDHNLAVLARGGWIPDGKEAFGVNLFEAWRKAHGLSDPKEVKLNSYRDEAIGETITIRARVALHKERATEGYNVFRDLYKLRDEQGRTLVLWTPSADQSKDGRRNPPNDGRPTTGAKVIVTLKIKSKKEYNDKLETQVTMVGDWAFDVGQDLDAPAKERAAALLEAQRLAKEERGEPEPTERLKRLAPLPNPKTVREVLAEAWRRAAKLPWRAAPLRPTKTKGYSQWMWEADAWTVVAEEMAAGRYGLDDAFKLAPIDRRGGHDLAEQPATGAAASQALQYLAHSDEMRPEFSYRLTTLSGGDARLFVDDVIFAAEEAGFTINRKERTGFGRRAGPQSPWQEARWEKPLDPALVEVMRGWFALLGGFEFGKTGKATLERPEKPVKVKGAKVDRVVAGGASSKPVPKSPASKSGATKKTKRPATVGDLLKQAYVRARVLPWTAMRELPPAVESIERNAWTAVIRALSRKYNLDSELEHAVYPELQFLEADDTARSGYRHMDAGGRMAEVVVAAAEAGFAADKARLRQATRAVEESQSKERVPVTGRAPDWATRNMGLLHALLGKSKRKELTITKEYADAEQELVSIMEKLQADVYRLEPHRIEKIIHNLRGLRRKQIAYVLGEARPDLQQEIHGYMTEEYAAGDKWRSEAEDSLLRPRQYAEREGAAEEEAQRNRLIALGTVVGGRTATVEARVAFLNYLRSRPERYLRLLLSTGSRDLTIGNARRVLRELEIAGFATGLQPEVMLKLWTESYKELYPLDFRQAPSELPSRLDESRAWQDWRRATIDAFDRVRRQPMDTEEQMVAIAPVGARRDLLFALEARPSDIHSMDDVVRGWLSPQFRGPLPTAAPLTDKPLVMGAYFEPATPEQAAATIIKYMRDVRGDDDDAGTRRWIASMTKSLREGGIIREEDDGRLVVDPDRVLAGREAMINDIAHAHTAAMRMAAASNDDALAVTRRRVMVAANSIAELRKIDVERVLDETPASERALVAETLAAQRPEFANEIREVMGGYRLEEKRARKATSAKKDKASAKAREILSRGEGVEWRRGDYRAVHHVPPSKTPGVAIYAKLLPEGSEARRAREKAMEKADFRWSNVRRRWEPRPSRWLGSSDAEKWGAAVSLAQELSGGPMAADAKDLADGQRKFRRVMAQRAEKPGTPVARKKRLGRGNETTVDSKLSDLLSDRAMVLGALATPATVEGAIQDIQSYLHPAGNDGYPGTSGFVAGWIKNMIATLMFEGKIELVSHRKFSGEVRSADMYQIRREMKLARAEAVEAARVMAERAKRDDDGRAGARADLARKARWGGDYEWPPAPVPVRMRATAFGDPGSRVELKLAGFSERETGAGSTSGVVTRIQAERGRIAVETDDGKTEWWRLVDVRLSSKKRAAAVAVARAAVAKGVSGHRRALPAAKGQRSGPRLPAARVTTAKAAARARQKPAATYDGTEIVAYIKRGAIVARLLDANGKGVGMARGFDAATMATGKVIGIEAKHVLVRLQDRYGRDGDGTRERWPTQEVWPLDDAKYELERASGKTRAYKEKREDEVARKKRRAASKAKHLVHDMADYKGLGNKRTSKRATAKAGERRRKVAPVIRKAQADVRREQVRTRERAEMDAYMRDVAANTPPEFPATQPPEGVRPGVRVALVDEDAGLGELSPTMRGVVQRIESAKGRAFVLADDGRAVFWPLSQMDTEATVVGEIKRAGERLASIGGNDFSLQRPASQVRAPMTGATDVQRAADAVAKAKSDKEEVENEVKRKPPTTKEGKARSKEKVKRAAKKLTEAEKALADKTKKAQQRSAARRCELEVEERSARKAVEAAERLGARLTAQHGAKLARLESKRATCKKGCKVSAKRLKATECKLLPTLKDIAGKLQDANAVRAKEMVKHAAAVAALAEMGVKVPPLSAAMPRQRSAGGAPPKRNCGTVCHIDLLGGLCGGQAAVVLPPRGTAAPFTVDTRFCLIEADRVISSHDPITFEPDQRYPSGVQERRYDRDKLEMSKVIGIAANPRPEIVINTSASPLDGTPIVTTEGFVLGGNGRSMGIRRNYINGGTEFSNYLVKNAAEFGFTAAQVRRFKQPMIVRVIDPPREEWSRYVRDLNQGLTQVMDAITESVSLARQMPQGALDALAEGLGDGEDLSTFFTQQASRGFVRALEAGGLITTQNRGRMLHPSGLLNEDGQALAIRQLSAAVLPHADLLEFAGAETRKALARSAPYWLAAASHGGDWDLRPSIELAMRDLIKAKAEQAADPGRFSLRKLFLQVDLFNPPQTKGHAFALRMLVLLAALADKPAVFAKLAKEFASDAAMFSGRTGTLLAPKTAMQSLEECAARVKIGKKPIDLAAEVADLDA